MSLITLILVLTFFMLFIGWCVILFLMVRDGFLDGICDYYLSVVKNGFGYIIKKFKRD